MTEPTILVAVRVADMLGAPAPGSVTGHCSTCREPVYIAQTSFPAIAAGRIDRIECEVCVTGGRLF